MLNTYALIDGVMCQTAIKDLYSRQEPLQIIPLYINTPYKDNFELGPIFIAFLADSTLVTELQKGNKYQSTTFIYSTEKFQTIADHLKHFITVTDETTIESLFRFADPLVTWYWLDSYSESELATILAPIDEWHVAKPIPDWEEQNVEWQIFRKNKESDSSISSTLNYLHEPQVDALNQAADFRFKNKLYHWLKIYKPTVMKNKTPDQIGKWIDYTFQEAKAFNVISERSIAIWMSLAADYGVDFITQKEGVYNNWVNEYSEYKKLPIEVNIQHFYEYLVLQNDQKKVVEAL